MNNKEILFSNDDIHLDTYEVYGEQVYRLTFFKDSHWNGDISFTKDGKIRYSDLDD